MKKQRTDNFDKFANQKKGSAIKEQYRQEKKKEKAASRAAGEEMRQKKKDKMRGIETPPKEERPQAARFGKRTQADLTDPSRQEKQTQINQVTGYRGQENLRVSRVQEHREK